MNFLEAKFDGKDLKIPSLENLKIKNPEVLKSNMQFNKGKYKGILSYQIRINKNIECMPG